MAHLYGTVKGRAKERGAIGTKNSGLSGHFRSWTAGVSVNIQKHDVEEDKVDIYLNITGGSDDIKSRVSLHFDETNQTLYMNGKKIFKIKKEQIKNGTI